MPLSTVPHQVASPSLSGYPQCDAKVQELAQKLWGRTTSSVRQYGKGRIVLDPAVQEATELYPDYATTAALLEEMKVPEDFVNTGPIRYAHRVTASEDIYFLANTTNRKVETTCTFRVQKGTPQLWNPVTAEIRALPQFAHQEKTTSIPVTFEPHQSFFVMFPRDRQPAVVTAIGRVNFPDFNTVANLEGPWQVAFDPTWGGPEKVTFETLQDWTTSRERGIKYYSGIASYRKTFDLPQATGKRLYLDLGTVHDLARVNLNGKDLGVVWCAPGASR